MAAPHSAGTPPSGSDRRVHDPSLRASIRDGISHSVMLGSGETYLGPFGIFLGATTLQIGFLVTLPGLLAAAMQWAGALTMERLGSRRRVIVTGVLAQALVFVPMALLPFWFGTGIGPAFGLIALAVCYQGAAGFVAPIWNSLIGDLVPEQIRGRFFGRRSRLTGIGTFASLLLAGGVLDVCARLGRAAGGFLLVFSVALLARVDSARWLARHRDPAFGLSPQPRLSFLQFLIRTPRSDFAQFVFFAATINFAVAFSAPYFALYMLRDLQLSYLEFTSVTAASAVSQFLTFGYWGGLSDRFGNKKILNICGFGIATVPLFWLGAPSVAYLIAIQFYGGFVWAGFSLAAANYMFDAVTPAMRARCAAYQGIVNGLFVFIGSLAGGIVATHLPQTIAIGDWRWTPASSLLVIFLLSGALRLIAAAVLLRRFRELRPVEAIRHRELLFRISHLKPIAGAGFSVLTGLFGEPRGDPDGRTPPREPGPPERPGSD